MELTKKEVKCKKTPSSVDWTVFIIGGVRGIWTLAWLLTTYSLSRGAPSASWVSLRIKEINIILPAYSSTPFHICQVVVSTGEKLSHYTTWFSNMIERKSDCEKWYIEEVIVKSITLERKSKKGEKRYWQKGSGVIVYRSRPPGQRKKAKIQRNLKKIEKRSWQASKDMLK